MSEKILVDSFGRKIDYLRVSVTKNCNFRCLYCMPNTPEIIENDLIPLPKMLEFIKIAINFGIRKVRITGGEPLLRKDLSKFVEGIYNEGAEVALTTNGFLLKNCVKALCEAGLRRVNISLDSLNKERIAKIAQKDALPQIMDGIFEAKRTGLGIKLNMVALRGINEDEILSMLDFAIENRFLLRYIEFMENRFANIASRGLCADEILSIIRTKYRINLVPKDNFGPAKLYEIAQNGAVFGIIAPHNDEFCTACNRIRLTAEGVICPCLYFEDAVDMSEAIKNGDKDAMIRGLLHSIANKPEKNKWSENESSNRAFYHTGG